MRKLRSRKIAAVLRNRRRVAEQVLENGGARARRVHALRDLGELERIAQEDEVAGARPHRERIRQGDLPRLVDDEIVQRAVEPLAGEEPGGPREELDVAAGLFEGRVVVVVPDELALELGVRVPGGLLETFEAHAGGTGDLLDLGEQIVDGLVALRGDADAPAVGQQVHDDPGARPRLAGAGRALEEEVAPVEPERPRLHLFQIGGLHRGIRRLEAADGGPLLGEDGAERRVAAIARRGSIPPPAAPRPAGSGSRRACP